MLDWPFSCIAPSFLLDHLYDLIAATGCPFFGESGLRDGVAEISRIRELNFVIMAPKCDFVECERSATTPGISGEMVRNAP